MSLALSEDRFVRRIHWVCGAILTAAVLVALTGVSAHAALGVFLGGAIAILSFHALEWQLRRAFLRPGRIPRQAGLFASYYVRYLASLFLVFVVIYYGWADPVPLLVGLSVVVAGIVVAGGWEAVATLKKGEN